MGGGGGNDENREKVEGVVGEGWGEVVQSEQQPAGLVSTLTAQRVPLSYLGGCPYFTLDVHKAL